MTVELDDQSFTYSELLYYVQILAFNLLGEERIVSADVICQCVERSLSTVSLLKRSFFDGIKFSSSLGYRDDDNPDG